MFVLSLTVCKICAKQEKCENFYLENKIQGQEAEERYLRHSTGIVRNHIGEFSQNFTYLGTYVYANLDTHTAHTNERTNEHMHAHTPHTHTQTHHTHTPHARKHTHTHRNSCV